MKSLAYTVIFVFLLSCQPANKKRTEAQFNVNKLLLSDSSYKSNSGLSINPPKGWIKTDEYDSILQTKIMYKTDNKMLVIYKSDTTDCALIISELPEKIFDTVKDSLDKSNSYPEKDSIWTNIQSSVFKYKSFEIIQFVYQNSQLIIFKLLTHRLSELYELNYILPRNEINEYLQSVESSIGSMN